MKTIKLLALGLMLILTASVQSQLSVNVHLGTPPSWAPAGYSDVRYYYLPDVEAYYDVQTSMFIYFSGNQWIRRNYLPSRYRNYDLHRGYKVVMKDYHGNSPYANFRDYKQKYAKGYRGAEQHNVGDRNQRRDIPERPRETYQPDNNRNKEFKNNKQNRGNDEGKKHDNSRNNQGGNDKDKKEGHDNGNRK